MLNSLDDAPQGSCSNTSFGLAVGRTGWILWLRRSSSTRIARNLQPRVSRPKAQSERRRFRSRPERDRSLLPTARFSIDIGGDQPIGYRRTKQKMVDAQPRVARERIPEILPEGVDALAGIERHNASVQPWSRRR
jgi:hypothetical protein